MALEIQKDLRIERAQWWSQLLSPCCLSFSRSTRSLLIASMSNETADAHRNVRKRAYHHPAIPAGVGSKEVKDFVRNQVGRTLNLEAEFPPTPKWHGFVEWEKEPARAKLASTILK